MPYRFRAGGAGRFEASSDPHKSDQVGRVDIKLALPLGTAVAWIGWATVYITIVLGFVLVAVTVAVRRLLCLSDRLRRVRPAHARRNVHRDCCEPGGYGTA